MAHRSKSLKHLVNAEVYDGDWEHDLVYFVDQGGLQLVLDIVEAAKNRMETYHSTWSKLVPNAESRALLDALQALETFENE